MASILTQGLNPLHFGMSFAGDQRQGKHRSFYSSSITPFSNSAREHQNQAAASPSDFAPPSNAALYHGHVTTPPTDNKVSFQQPHHQSRPRTMSNGTADGTARSTSPDGSASSANAAAGQPNTKTGRKGDPRMHRAVAARLQDPNMTLFEALKAGGFDYPDDNNPSYVDSEKITLAQRKNQLSRRLRIARRTDNVSKYPAPSPSDNQNKFESLVNKQKESFQMMQQTMELERRTSSGMYTATGLKRARSAPAQKSSLASAAMCKPAGKRRSLIDDDDDDEEESDKKQPSQMMAKFHPQFQHLVVPPQLQFGHSGQFAGAGQPMNSFGMNQGVGMFYPNAGYQIPNMGPTGPMNNSNMAGSASKPSGSSNISGVALRSLTNTAQSVGLSLEQLALALSSTRNLAHIVLGDDDDKNPTSVAEQKKKKQELALQMHQHEVRPVYARCMLLAGYKSETTTETSKEYLKFAWKAWQKEGRRLRDLLEENDMLVADAPDFHGLVEGNEKPAKKIKITEPQEEEAEKTGEDGHTHSHNHKRDCHTADGRHIHRLEKCGHKAILHQPKDGDAHIDFVVGDKVECYAGISAKEGSSWPSQYACDQCGDHDYANSEISEIDPPLRENAPKVLDLKSLDLQGNEWNVDFDETIGGLVRLGESTETLGNRSDSSVQGSIVV